VLLVFALGLRLRHRGLLLQLAREHLRLQHRALDVALEVVQAHPSRRSCRLSSASSAMLFSFLMPSMTSCTYPAGA
jgi:hypothetical protein